MSSLNVLITGGAGFIGSNLALRLVSKGHRVTVLDNLSTQVHGNKSALVATIQGKVNFIEGDVRNRNDWQHAIQGQNAIVHLAAETGTGQSMYEIARYADVNVNGTAIMLDILANQPHDVSKVLVASSRSLYGEGKAHCLKHGDVYPRKRSDADMKVGDFSVKCPICGSRADIMPTDEDSRLHPSSVYGITKLTQEQMIMTVGHALGIAVTALRYQNVYGPGQSLSNPYTGILSIFSTRIRNGNGINVFEDGLESRDFVYIEDVVDATVLALLSERANNRVFNVGSGVATDVLTVARTLCEVYGSKVEISVTGNYRLGDIAHNYADLSAIRDALGFNPKIDFADGVRRFAAWVLEREVAVDSYQKSIEEMKLRGLMN